MNVRSLARLSNDQGFFRFAIRHSVCSSHVFNRFKVEPRVISAGDARKVFSGIALISFSKPRNKTNFNFGVILSMAPAVLRFPVRTPMHPDPGWSSYPTRFEIRLKLAVLSRA